MLRFRFVMVIMPNMACQFLTISVSKRLNLFTGRKKLRKMILMLFAAMMANQVSADVIRNYTLTNARFADGTTVRGVWSYNKTLDSVAEVRIESISSRGETLTLWRDDGVPLKNAPGLAAAGEVRVQLNSITPNVGGLSIQFKEATGRLLPAGVTGIGTTIGNPKSTAFTVLTEQGDVSVREDCASPVQNYRSLSYCQDYQKVLYRGLRPSDAHGRGMIRNPERGFRTEAIASVGPLSQPFAPNMIMSGDAISKWYQRFFSGRDKMNPAEQYQVVQQYVYLDKFNQSKNIEPAIKDLEHIFDQARKARVKLLLIFAYKPKGGVSEPNPQLVRQHMVALQPVLAKHLGEIYAFQFGWFGLWGELHSSGYSEVQKKFILDSFLELMPPERKITIRNSAYRRPLVKDSPRNNSMVGFGNAFYTKDDHPRAKDNDYTTGSNDYNDAVKWGPSTIVDIEMPYTSPIDETTGKYKFTEDQWYMNHVPKNFGIGTIWRFSKMGVSTFSLTHCMTLCIESTRSEPVNYSQLKGVNVVVDPEYFTFNNQLVNRTAFEYLRDHLGYRLRLTEALFPAFHPRGQVASFSFKINNSGFSRPVNKRPFDVVLLDSSNKIVWRQRAFGDSDEWRPGVDAAVTLPNKVIDVPIGEYQVAVALPDASPGAQSTAEYAIQLANGGSNFRWLTTSEDRFNVIGSMTVTAGH